MNLEIYLLQVFSGSGEVTAFTDRDSVLRRAAIVLDTPKSELVVSDLDCDGKFTIASEDGSLNANLVELISLNQPRDNRQETFAPIIPLLGSNRVYR